MNSILKSPGRTSILPMFNSWEAKNIKPHQYRALFINSVSSKKTDEECDLDIVPNEGRNIEVKYAMSNSLGFGGHNSSIIFKK